MGSEFISRPIVQDRTASAFTRPIVTDSNAPDSVRVRPIVQDNTNTPRFLGVGVRGSRGGTFQRSARRGIKQTAGLYGQFLKSVGDATGFAGAIEVGDELMQEAMIEALSNPARIEGIEDLTFANAGEFVMQSLGEQVLNIGLAIASGGIGALAARAAVGKAVMSSLAAKSAAGKGGEFVAKNAASRFFTTKSGQAALAKATKVGAGTGVFSGFLPINTGEIIAEQRNEQGVAKPPLGASLALGALSTSLEVLGFGLVAKTFFGNAKKEVVESAVRTVMRRVGHTSLAGVAAEGGTEAAQEVLVIASQKINDPTFSITDAITSSEGLSRIAFAGLSGAVVGGVLGGAGGVASGVQNATIIGRKRRDLRDDVEGTERSLKGMFPEDKEGEVTTLFSLENAGKQLNARVAKVKSAVKMFARSVAAGASNLTQNKAFQAAEEQQQEALGVMERESGALDLGEETLDEETKRQDKTFTKLRARLAELHVKSQLGKGESAATREFVLKISEAMAKARKLSVLARGRAAAELVKLAEQGINRGQLQPNSVSKAKLTSLINLAEQHVKAARSKQRSNFKAARNLLNGRVIQLNNAFNKAPAAPTQQFELFDEQQAPLQPEQEADPSFDPSRDGTEDFTQEAAFEREQVLGQTEQEADPSFDPSRDGTDQITAEEAAFEEAQPSRDARQRAQEEADFDPAFDPSRDGTDDFTAEDEAAAAQHLPTPVAKVTESIRNLIDGKILAVLAPGHTLKSYATAIGLTAEKLAQRLAKKGLRPRVQNGELIITRGEYNELSADQIKDKIYPVNKDTTEVKVPVVITNAETSERIVVDAADTATFKDVFGEGDTVSTPAEAITEQVGELVAEEEAKTTTVRFYGDNGNFLEEVRVQPQLDLLAPTHASVDAAVEALRAKYGVQGFALANDKALHKARLKDPGLQGQLYRALWGLRAKIRAGKPLPPSTIVMERETTPRDKVRSVPGQARLDRFKKARAKVAITLREFRIQRQDHEYIINMMMNLVSRNSDPNEWAVRAIKHPELEEQTALYERQIDASIAGELGLEAQGLFSDLVVQPQQLWGVSINSLGKPSSTLVEVKETPDGWMTVQGRPAFVFTRSNLHKLKTKMQKANLKENTPLNRYGKKLFPNSEINEWDATIEEMEDGFFVIKQTFPGMDTNIIFNQVRKVIDRGAAIKDGDTVIVNGEAVDAMIFRIEVEDSNGVEKKLHLGEITKLGQLQRAGPGNILLGTALTQAHENFLYGLTTMLSMGYKLGDTLAAFEELSVEKHPEVSHVAKGRGRNIGTDIQRIVDLKKRLKDPNEILPDVIRQEIKEIQRSINLRQTLLKKIIYGRRITFGKSLASQKSLFALERMFKPDFDGNLSEVALMLTEEQRTDLASMSLKEAAETLIDFLMDQVEGEVAPFQAKEIKVKRQLFQANLETGKVTKKGKPKLTRVLDIGTHTIEQTSAAIVVREKMKGKARGKIVAQLPTSIIEEEAVALAKDVIDARVDSPEIRRVSLRIQNKDTSTKEGRAVAAFRRTQVEANAVDEELLSVVISLYGLQTRAGATAVADTVNVTSGDTNFLEPSASAAVLNPKTGERLDTSDTVLQDETVGLDEFSEVDFQARVRSKFDEEASKEVPFKPNIPQSTVPKSTGNPFIAVAEQVENTIKGWNILPAINAVLKRINIKERIILYDERSLPALRTRFEKIKNNPKSTAEQKRLAGRLLNSLAAVKRDAGMINGRINVTVGPNLSDRTVLIYIPQRADNSRGWSLAHELGHLVQYVYLDAMDTKVRAEVLDAFRGDDQEKTEMFANWIASDLILKEPALAGEDAAVKKVFRGIVKALHEVYEWAKQFGQPINKRLRTATGFIAALNTYADGQTNSRKRFEPPFGMTDIGKSFLAELERVNAGPYIRNTAAEFSADEVSTTDRTEDAMFQNYTEDIQNWAARVQDNPVRGLASLVRTADSELRAMGLGWLADRFHARPVSTASNHTIFRDIMQEMAPWEKQLAALLDSVPGSRIGLWEMMRNKTPSAKTIEARAQRKIIIEALLLKTDTSTLSAENAQHVKAIRNYFKRLHKWYTEDMGLELGKVDDYYPMMLDTLRVDKNRGDFIKRLLAEGFTESEAQETRTKLTRDEDGGLVNGFQAAEETGEFFGPGLASNKHRAKGKWTDALRESLVDGSYYQEDIATTMIAYTHMLVRRAVWQKAFQDTSPDISKLARYKHHKLNPNSPIAQLLLDVHEAPLNDVQRQRVLQDILPAYAGQLGLRTNSHIRKLGAGIVIYQNLRLLAFAIFSQFVDVGTLFTRGGWEDAQMAMKILMDKTTRDKAKEMLQEIGALRVGLTEHVLNDQALNTFMTGKAKRINDLFFKYNQMEGWTNLMRTMGLVSGRNFLRRHAKAVNDNKDVTSQRYLDELGMGKPEDIAALVEWDGFSTDNKDINAALNRYIDESMIRPDASIRPVWMSDPAYAIFAHLKGFMFGFHETFLRRVGREAHIHQNLLPLILLGMMALPFAAVGYELRRKIVGGGPKPEGFAYIKELVERSGLPGAWQPILDMEQADEFGKPFGLGVSGPAVEQLYDFFSKDYESWLPKALPVVAASPHMRNYFKDSML